MERIRIGIDADGGDKVKTKGKELKPIQRIAPAIIYVMENFPNIDFTISGQKELIKRELGDYSSRVTVLPAKQIDTNPNSPRPKKDSSLRLLMEPLREREVQGIFTLGDTYKLCAIAESCVGRMPQLKNGRMPCLTAHFPSKSGGFVLSDVGASTELDIETSYCHGIMAAAYVQQKMQIQRPRLGIVSVGTEKHKGSKFDKMLDRRFLESKLVSEGFVQYIGKCEMTHGFGGEAEVLIIDGAAGNKALKAIEGMLKYVKETFFEAYNRLPGLHKFSLNAGLLVGSPGIKRLKKDLESADYRIYNGAIAQGFNGNGVFVKGHGNSDKVSCRWGLVRTASYLEGKVSDHLTLALDAYL